MTRLSIVNWSAWAPGLRDRTDWNTPHARDQYLDALQGLESPEVEWVPSRKRRRCSTHTRIALEIGFDCCDDAGIDPGNVKTVFATRHGEIRLTGDLMKTLADDELLSPMGFGNSVHNTPSSYFCMCADNHHPSRTVSACEETFQSGLFDAVSLLDLAPDVPVLFVCTHVSPAEPLDRYDSFKLSSWGVAFLLSSTSSETELTLSREEEKHMDRRKLPPSITFLNWFLHGETRELKLPGTNQSHAWTFTRTDDRNQM